MSRVVHPVRLEAAHREGRVGVTKGRRSGNQQHQTPANQSYPWLSQYPPGNELVTSMASIFFALLNPSLVGIRNRTGAPHGGSSGCKSKSSASRVCVWSALAMSILVEYPSKQVNAT